VKRYHVEVREMTVPSEAEVQERKVERIVTLLAAEGQTLPLEDFAEFAPIARRVADHEHRDRIVALLLRRNFQPPPPEAEDADEAKPAGGPPRRYDSGGGGDRRSGGGGGDAHRRRRRR
jgi:hypothetical protein